MKIKIITIALIALSISGLYAQEKLPDIVIIDTIFTNVLKISHVMVEKCPGIMSGLPCARYIQYIDEMKFSKKNIIRNNDKVLYKLSKEGIIILDINQMFMYHSLFKNLYIESKNKNSMELDPSVYRKRKRTISEAKYFNVMIYVAKVKVSKLNEILFNNLMIQTNEEYVDAYLIYN